MSMKRVLSEALIYAGEQECHSTFAATGGGLTALWAVLLEDLCELLSDPSENVVVPGGEIAVFAGMPDEYILLDALAW
jgi:hypothetical protein